jgi:hypothetical protein
MCIPIEGVKPSKTLIHTPNLEPNLILDLISHLGIGLTLGWEILTILLEWLWILLSYMCFCWIYTVSIIHNIRCSLWLRWKSLFSGPKIYNNLYMCLLSRFNNSNNSQVILRCFDLDFVFFFAFHLNHTVYQ